MKVINEQTFREFIAKYSNKIAALQIKELNVPAKPNVTAFKLHILLVKKLDKRFMMVVTDTPLHIIDCICMHLQHF